MTRRKDENNYKQEPEIKEGLIDSPVAKEDPQFRLEKMYARREERIIIEENAANQNKNKGFWNLK